ncbi:MAG: DNA-directed RNA polymerase III, subunit Rpc31 [Benjaminiella poitrasii]|nr:MAG: DNA-directed RNA polymerase III, subunit Rpc31 [Benjaminiella poitrasii]
MSRGGRGGGGFGRGGGGGPQSGAMQLVSFDLLKDLGSGSLFNVNTALFPEMDVPIPRKPTSNEVQEWKLKKEYLALIKESPFHLTPLPPPPDIERYSDKYKVKVQKRSLKDIETNLDFFPEELQTILDPKRKKKQKARTVDAFGEIQALLDAEAKDDEDENDEDKEKEEEGENEEEYEDEEELIDDNDYAETYFDNGEGDDDDDGDGEDAYS